MSLPVGWEARDAGGRIVYINHVAKTTTYDDPRPLPTGWSVAPPSGADPRPVFIDHVNKTTSWLDPRPPPFIAMDPSATGGGGGAPPPSSGGTRVAVAALPVPVAAVAHAPAPYAPAPYAPSPYSQPAYAGGAPPPGGAGAPAPSPYSQPAFAAPVYATAPPPQASAPPSGYAQPAFATAPAHPPVYGGSYGPAPTSLFGAAVAAVFGVDTSRPPLPKFPRRWIYGLCDCHHALPGTLARGCFCPCWLHTETQRFRGRRHGRGRGRDDDGCGNCVLCCITPCVWPIITCSERGTTRRKYDIYQDGDVCTDCCVHCCCWGCALTQEHIEVKTREGFMPVPPGVQLMD